MKQTSLSKNQRTKIGKSYMNILGDYMREVQGRPRNQKSNLHVFPINTTAGNGEVCPIEFMNQEVNLLFCADRGLIHFDQTSEMDFQYLASLEDFAKSSFRQKKDCVLLVVDGFIVSTVIVKRKGVNNKSVPSVKGFD